MQPAYDMPRSSVCADVLRKRFAAVVQRPTRYHDKGAEDFLLGAGRVKQCVRLIFCGYPNAAMCLCSLFVLSKYVDPSAQHDSSFLERPAWCPSSSMPNASLSSAPCSAAFDPRARPGLQPAWTPDLEEDITAVCREGGLSPGAAAAVAAAAWRHQLPCNPGVLLSQVGCPTVICHCVVHAAFLGDPWSKRWQPSSDNAYTAMVLHSRHVCPICN